MKKTFLFLMAAFVVAVFSSCQPINTPEPDQPSTDTIPSVDDPSVENPIEDEEDTWSLINAEIQAFFGTTESIPAPAEEFEVSLTNKAAGNDTWKSGIYSIGFKGSILTAYGEILTANGYTFNQANSQAGYDCYVGSGAYIIYIEQSGMNLMQVHKKSDVIN